MYRVRYVVANKILEGELYELDFDHPLYYRQEWCLSSSRHYWCRLACNALDSPFNGCERAFEVLEIVGYAYNRRQLSTRIWIESVSKIVLIV